MNKNTLKGGGGLKPTPKDKVNTYERYKIYDYKESKQAWKEWEELRNILSIDERSTYKNEEDYWEQEYEEWKDIL